MPEIAEATTTDEPHVIDAQQYADEPEGQEEGQESAPEPSPAPRKGREAQEPAEGQEAKEKLSEGAQKRFDALLRERDGLRHTVGPIRQAYREMNERLQAIEEERRQEELALQALEADAEDEDLDALAEEDRIAWLAERARRGDESVASEVRQLRERMDAEAQQRQVAETAQQSYTQGRQLADAFRAKVPDYDAATKHLMMAKFEEAREAYPEATDQEIFSWLQTEVGQLHYIALQRPDIMAQGGGPYLLYEYAKAAGYQPQGDAPPAEAGTNGSPGTNGSGKLSRKREALRQASSLSSASGSAGTADGKYTPREIANMTDAEYGELISSGFDPKTMIRREE